MAATAVDVAVLVAAPALSGVDNRFSAVLVRGATAPTPLFCGVQDSLQAEMGLEVETFCPLSSFFSFSASLFSSLRTASFSENTQPETVLIPGFFLWTPSCCNKKCNKSLLGFLSSNFKCLLVPSKLHHV